VRTHLQSQDIYVKEVYIFPSKIQGTKLSKVGVALEQKEQIKDENLQPHHCKIQDWIYKPKTARKTKTWQPEVKMATSKLFSLLFSFFRLFFIFAATLTEITIASHNLHGFKASANYHKSCLQTHGGIWMAQELWLTEQQLPTMQQLCTQFVARSGMEDAVASGIFRGRPFGGVNISWSPNLNHLVSQITNTNELWQWN
jgi:hypothetical protein